MRRAPFAVPGPALRRVARPGLSLWYYPLGGAGRVSPEIGGLRGLWASFANAEKNYLTKP